jgi:MraZ protein
MNRFVGNFTLRLDSKGRVSIPAPYRKLLGRGDVGLYCYPALDRRAIDAGGDALMAEIEALIARFAPFSDERERFAVALYGTSETFKLDAEGRVILSDQLKAHAEIKEQVVFVGLGHKFQIWEPDRFRAELAEATQTVRALRERPGSQSARKTPGARE